jgi:hypothetical protein
MSAPPIPASSLEKRSRQFCRALTLETNGRVNWWIAVDTLAYRLKEPAAQLQQPIYFAKMHGWIDTAGVPPHSVILKQLS